MAGLFANAQVVKAEAPKGRKPAAPEVELKGLERFAAINAAVKTLSALAATEEASLKEQMGQYFITTGIEEKRRPINFKGLDNTAEGSCQLKVRSTASKLSDDEIKLLAEHEIPTQSVVKTPEAFLINPKYTNDMSLLAKVEEALTGVDLPDDFLMKQEEVANTVVTEDSLNAIFLKAAEEAELLLPVVSTLAILPKMTGDYWAILDAMMQPEGEPKAVTA